MLNLVKWFVPEQNDETPVDLKMLSSMSITIAQFKDGNIETFVQWDWCNGYEGIESTTDWKDRVQDRGTK